MEEAIHKFIDEAVMLEFNMARLYSIFSEYVDEDRSFWNRLEMEEKNHAALLKTAKDFVSFNRFPRNILPADLEILVESNKMVGAAIDKFIKNPGRENAFSYALELENSAGEIHFQDFMNEEAEDHITQIFQRLNRFDKDHAERILQYWNSVSQKP